MEKGIESIIKARGIRWLCHFTPISNIENIKKSGLITRDLLGNQSTVTDMHRWDRYSHAICSYISKPNKWMLEKKTTGRI